MTDADLLLGYLSDTALLGGEIHLSRKLAEQALARLGKELGLNAAETALGVISVADAEMIRALRLISVERGLDPREFALVAFGGAGPLHACSLADELAIATVLVPKVAGVLSALGLAVAEQRRDFVAPYRGELCFDELERQAQAQLPGGRLRRLVDARYRGQAFELTVDAENWRERFHAAHERRYGFSSAEDPVEPIHLRVVATVPATAATLAEEEEEQSDGLTGSRLAFLDGRWVELEVFDRTRMGFGSRVSGPAIVEFPEATCLVRDHWEGEVDGVGTLVLTRP